MRRIRMACLALALVACGTKDVDESNSCEPASLALDPCGGTSLCVPDPENPDEGVCRQQRVCDPDGTCPVGSRGAVCSEGILDREQPICLQGLCTGAENCPTDFECAELGDGGLGVCALPRD